MRTRFLWVFSLAALALLATFSVVLAQEARIQGEVTDRGVAGGPVSPLAQVGTGFTYQGQLKSSGAPVNANCDFQFSLYDSLNGPGQIGGTQTSTNVPVVNGIFTVMLNKASEFGVTPFDGAERYLAIAVRCPTGVGVYTGLAPRQRLSAAPYAFSLKPEAWITATITGTGVLTDAGVLRVNNGYPDYCGYAAGVRSTQGSGSTGVIFCDSAPFYGNGEWVGVLGTGDLYGAGGVSRADYGWGLYGRANGEHGTGLSVNTSGKSSFGAYVINYSSVITGGFGIYGVKGSQSGYDLLAFGWFPGAVVGDTDVGNGVIGLSSGSSGVGVMGIIDGGADRAVAGYAEATTGYTLGVYGQSDSTDGTGVYGGSPRYGVYGSAYTTDGIGVVGTQSGSSIDLINSFWAPGGGFVGRNGIVAATSTDGGYGVAGVFEATTGSGAAVRGRSASSSAYGVQGVNTGGGYAGYFSGDVSVTGDLSAGGAKPFRIDYPLDPANKYLYHYAVESPQVQNQYNGTVTLDASGEAVVTLPEYFSAVNTGPFQYQLTAIGAPGPNLYIAQEVTGSQFKIAGGTPGMKVSWLLFGLRNDPWMRDNPHTDVADKPANEVGTYIYPQGYGQSATLQLGFLDQENPYNLTPLVLPADQQNTGPAGTTQFPQQPDVPGSSVDLP